MSAANEQLATASKPRISPLDLRNTDLVSRLLAATPPYLYNMSLLPNTYFFSEMLRSLVHAKTESARNGLHHRRSRKRPWLPAGSELYHKAQKSEQSTEWISKASHTESKSSESPLELTTNKVETSMESRAETSTSPNEKSVHFSPSESKPDVMIHNHSSMFPGLAQAENAGSVILPPPPPPPAPAPSLWYPHLYPAPYGIDPLHFFIDLRVSGHIYDRKNQKEQLPEISPNPLDHLSSSKERLQSEIEGMDVGRDFFKSSKHASAFSVPEPRSQRSYKPMNLSSTGETTKTKFDVKSMGFEQDSSSNKTSTNYILNNIGEIYKNVNNTRDIVKAEGSTDSEEMTEEEKQKRDKDLRALIGLELVVDYMSGDKPKELLSDISTTDTESISRNDSPALEVVAISEECSSKHLGPDSYT